MAILKIKSENPNLSYIINKHPDTFSMKEYRQGIVFGYFHEGEYITYFKDGDDEMSLVTKKNEESFEYNDTSRYNSPLAIIGIINTILVDTIKDDKHSEYDVTGEFETEITINQIFLYDKKYFDIIGRYYPQVEFEFKELSDRNYTVTIKGKYSVRFMLALTYSLGVIYYCRTDNPWLHESEITKYIKVLNVIDAPYFVKYVFKSNIISSLAKFNEVKELLDTNHIGQVWDFQMGNTHGQRKKFIQDNITGFNNIVDIGCGDMTSYGLSLAKKLGKNDKLYFGIDNDKDITDNLRGKIAGRDIDNITILDTFENFIECEYPDNFDVIMSEVFEHVTLKKDTEWIRKIISNVNFNSIIITTPNKDFNTNYLFTDEDMRLDDHVFEMSGNEFTSYFNNLLKDNKKLTYEFHHIGDSVDGITPTQAVIIKKI